MHFSKLKCTPTRAPLRVPLEGGQAMLGMVREDVERPNELQIEVCPRTGHHNLAMIEQEVSKAEGERVALLQHGIGTLARSGLQK